MTNIDRWLGNWRWWNGGRFERNIGNGGKVVSNDFFVGVDADK